MTEWNDRHVLVTGASRGLGLEFTRAWLARGARVTATCREPARADALNALAAGNPALAIAALDTTEAGAAAALAEGMETLDVLVNNAGIATANHPFDPIVENDGEELMTVLRTNVAGAVTTTNALLPALRRGTLRTVVMLSSDLGSIERTFTAQSAKVAAGGVSSYRMSKAALNMAARVFAAELADEAFRVVALSPGWVATDMGSSGDREPPLTPAQSVSGCIEVISNLTDADNGRFFGQDGEPLPW